MTAIVPAEGILLDRILELTYPLWHDGLSRQSYRQFDAALMRTPWALNHLRRYALVEGSDLLASAMQYNLAAVIDERPVRVCGIGAVFTAPKYRGGGHARSLVEHLLERAERDGSDMALMFSDAACAPFGFAKVPTMAAELTVVEPPRHGAPMTLVRGGEARDLAAVAAMGQIRARPFRFHLERSVSMIHHAIARKRLLAGLGASGARELHFFIAEEGITAAAYIVITVAGREWTIEECGDRDSSGARVGALLQALIAREPIERRPLIRGWLPPGFAPAQIATISATAATPSMMVRFIGARMTEKNWSGDEVLYWQTDIF